MLLRPRLAASAPVFSVCILALIALWPIGVQAADLEESLRKALAEVRAAEAAKGEAGASEEKKSQEAAKTPADAAAKSATRV